MEAISINTPQVSVIVPIYNVEKYVGKCLNSLREQSLKQIEVLMIDDGSTDRSGRIADVYASNDWPRFRVIHTDHRGLSAARNRGIDEAEADWIMFVDSDDWVDIDFCRIPYESAHRYGAELVIFRSLAVNNGKIEKPKKVDATIGLIDEYAALNYGSAVVWNKLYAKKLFDLIKYPEGRIFEDIATTHKLIHNAKQILLISNYLYFHLNRAGSITNPSKPLIQKDAASAQMERCRDLISYGFPEEKIRRLMCISAIRYLSRHSPGDIYYDNALKIIDGIKGIPSGLNYKQIMALIVWRMDPRLFHSLCRLIGRL